MDKPRPGDAVLGNNQAPNTPFNALIKICYPVSLNFNRKGKADNKRFLPRRLSNS
jgi:hypothetical protein